MATGIQRRVLIVEDSIDLRMLMRQYLESEGFSVMLASHGAEALQLLKQTDELPGAILLDLMMPVMDGYQFRCEQLRSEKLLMIPTIVMTAGRLEQSEIARLGSCELLPKPVDIDDLLNTLERIFSYPAPLAEERLSSPAP